MIKLLNSKMFFQTFFIFILLHHIAIVNKNRPQNRQPFVADFLRFTKTILNFEK